MLSGKTCCPLSTPAELSSLGLFFPAKAVGQAIASTQEVHGQSSDSPFLALGVEDSKDNELMAGSFLRSIDESVADILKYLPRSGQQGLARRICSFLNGTLEYA